MYRVYMIVLRLRGDETTRTAEYFRCGHFTPSEAADVGIKCSMRILSLHMS